MNLQALIFLKKENKQYAVIGGKSLLKPRDNVLGRVSQGGLGQNNILLLISLNQLNIIVSLPISLLFIDYLL